jgi:Sap, sulfolipid-1-addressing protein
VASGRRRPRGAARRGGQPQRDGDGRRRQADPARHPAAIPRAVRGRNRLTLTEAPRAPGLQGSLAGRHDVVVPDLLVLAIASAFYPTLLAISVLLLATPNPQPMLLGYVGGAMTASIACGLAVVFVLAESGAVESSRPTVSPAVDVAGGILVIVLGWLVATGRLERLRDRRRAARVPLEPRPSWSSRVLSRGSVPLAFGVAMALSAIPGLFYLVALKDIAADGYGPVVAVILVVTFNVVQFALIEVPLVAFAVAPERTGAQVDRLNAALKAHARTIAVTVCLVVGLYLIARGVAGLVS